MAKKLPVTPKSQIKSMIRRYLWLRSRERAAAIKRENNTCQECGRKGSVAKGREVKIEVHHKKEINWDKIFKLMYKELLVVLKKLEVLCKECHKEETKKQRRIK